MGETDIENRLMDSGRGEDRVRSMERVTWKLTAICKIHSRWKFAICLREFKQGFCNNLEGWDGEEDGGAGSKRRGHMYTYG